MAENHIQERIDTSFNLDKIEELSRELSLSLIKFPGSKVLELPDLKSNGKPEEIKHTLVDFAKKNYRNLEIVWTFYLISTIVNYLILIVSLVWFVITLTKGISFNTYILGGTSLASFLSTLIWKPQSKLLEVSLELNNISNVNRSFQLLFDAIEEIEDEKLRAERAKETIGAIFQSIDRK